MNHAYIGLGSNLGESDNFLRLALQDLAQQQSIHQLVCSPFFRSSPVDSSGPDYVNAVAYIQTSLTSLDLLRLLQSIELKHGRQRPYRNAPRTLDLDILLFNDEQNQDPILTLPHPRMFERAFVLEPLQILLQNPNVPSVRPLALQHINLPQLIERAKATGQAVTLMPDDEFAKQKD